MDLYQQFVAEFIARTQAALNGLRQALINAGVNANAITVEEVQQEGVNDLRYRITATRAGRTLAAYVELTSAGFVDGQMALVVTLWVEGNGGQIVTSYAANVPVSYTLPASIDTLFNRLAAIESVTAGELVTAGRAFLRV